MAFIGRPSRRGGLSKDEVIYLYIELLKERAKSETERFLKCHFFTTFFYNKKPVVPSGLYRELSGTCYLLH
ncbi:unnamed protein product [Urochloa humidicola]